MPYITISDNETVVSNGLVHKYLIGIVYLSLCDLINIFSAYTDYKFAIMLQADYTHLELVHVEKRLKVGEVNHYRTENMVCCHYCHLPLGIANWCESIGMVCVACHHSATVSIDPSL